MHHICAGLDKTFMAFPDLTEQTDSPLQILHARALCGTKRYRACLDFLKGVVLLPSEHRDTGTAIWHAAQTALGLPLTWPENLGEGEPFPPEGAND